MPNDTRQLKPSIVSMIPLFFERYTEIISEDVDNAYYRLKSSTKGNEGRLQIISNDNMKIDDAYMTVLADNMNMSLSLLYNFYDRLYSLKSNLV